MVPSTPHTRSNAAVANSNPPSGTSICGTPTERAPLRVDNQAAAQRRKHHRGVRAQRQRPPPMISREKQSMNNVTHGFTGRVPRGGG